MPFLLSLPSQHSLLFFLDLYTLLRHGTRHTEPLLPQSSYTIPAPSPSCGPFSLMPQPLCQPLFFLGGGRESSFLDTGDLMFSFPIQVFPTLFCVSLFFMMEAQSPFFNLDPKLPSQTGLAFLLCPILLDSFLSACPTFPNRQCPNFNILKLQPSLPSPFLNGLFVPKVLSMSKHMTMLQL